MEPCLLCMKESVNERQECGEARVTESHHSQLTSAYTRRDTGHDTETHGDPYRAVSPIQRREGFESPGVGAGAQTLTVPHSHT